MLSGGINQIDTGHTYRQHRSELVVGKALKTMFKKFGMQRDEVFINSKQGFIGENHFEQAPAELVL